MLQELLKYRRVELVKNFLTVPLGDDETRVSKHSEMARDRGPARIETIGDLPRRQGALAEKLQDPPARPVGERAEYLTR
ncbi:MAG TPA: hypothetical protein VGI12_21575 [Vicinamibacterales bacterium]